MTSFYIILTSDHKVTMTATYRHHIHLWSIMGKCPMDYRFGTCLGAIACQLLLDII
jgi:hypothetical protein